MRVLDNGHLYELDQRGSDARLRVQFADHEGDEDKPGVTTQEVLRMLIDRTMYCDACMPCELNQHIIDHLRMALVLHESRALIRKVEKGELRPEETLLATDGHFYLQQPDMKREYVVPMTKSDYDHEPGGDRTKTGGVNQGTCEYTYR